MQSPDHPELAFVQARYYQKGRPNGKPLWNIAHTMEAGESSTRAENTAAYFADPGDGRTVSSHYCADNDSIVCCVKLADTAFTVGNIGNSRGINWEFSGFASQTGAQWGDEFSMAMLARAAPYWAKDAAKYGIPIVRRTVPELQAMKPGLTTHNDLRLAFGGTTHTDPGSAFPWSQFINMIKGANMALVDPDDVYIRNALRDNEPFISKGVKDAAMSAGYTSDISDRLLLELIAESVRWRASEGSPIWTIIGAVAALDAKLAVMDAKLDQIIASHPGIEHTHEIGGSTGPAMPVIEP